MTGVFDQGYLALPATEKPAPAIMVIPAWWGLNAFFKQFCDAISLGIIIMTNSYPYFNSKQKQILYETKNSVCRISCISDPLGMQ